MTNRLLKKKLKTLGQAPGALVYVGDNQDPNIHIDVIDYDKDSFLERSDVQIKECLDLIKTPQNTWINIEGIQDIQAVQKLGSHFGLHPLILEDIVNSTQRSKLDDYKDNIYIVMRMLKYNKEKEEVEDEQVSLILGENYLISFLESGSSIFLPVKKRLTNSSSRIRIGGSDYLCYSLIDCIVDHYFEILEQVDQNLENLEEEIAQSPNGKTLIKIQRIKRQITQLRKSVWPMREVINHFRRIETSLIKDSTKLYIQDVYDHTIQAIDTIESFRDIVSGMFDIYLSNINLRMNEIMKVLTIVSTIFVPLTFVASIYGMNFEHMPELHYKWGYPIVLIVMLFAALIMLVFFRKKRWI